MVLVSIIAFILVIGIIILVHEAGHFFIARKCGVKCLEFSIGMGPIIKQWKSKETTISLRWIPLGGYVAMVDGNESELYIEKNKEIGLNLTDGAVSEFICDTRMHADVRGIVRRVELKSLHGEPLEIDIEVEDNLITYPVLDNALYVLSKTEKTPLVPYKESFDSKKIWQRIAILIAGAAMNFVLGLLFCIIASFAQGVPNANSNVIGEVGEASAFANAGIKSGAKLEKIEYKGKTYEIKSWTDFQSTVNNSYCDSYEPIVLTYSDLDGNHTKEILPTVYLYKVGITNDDLPKTLENVNGALLGTVGIEYDDKDIGHDYKVKRGDLITGVKVSLWNGKSYDESSDYQDVNGWEDLISKILGAYDSSTGEYANDSLTVSFKVKEGTIDENGFVTFGQEKISKRTVAYSKEVLNAQNVASIRYIFGVSPTTYRNFSLCMEQAFEKAGSYFSLVVRTLKVLVAPSNGARTIGLKNMSSVVGIYSMVSNYLTAGIAAFLFFVAMLSINIGLMNLLPIPALDGGRIVFVLYELITGRKPNKKVEAVINLIAYVLLFALFIYVTGNDIRRLFNK
ncbi:MAG: site-2 protease family protein [Acholeplasmatales bacterium]|nr:site-2 protease family protein [Acholeplasmatales bacterium]